MGHEQHPLRSLCVYVYHAEQTNLTDMHIYTSYVELKTNHLVEQI